MDLVWLRKGKLLIGLVNVPDVLLSLPPGFGHRSPATSTIYARLVCQRVWLEADIALERERPLLLLLSALRE